MSRYMLNKLMWEVDSSHQALEDFRANSQGFLDRWQEIAPEPPIPNGGALTEEEERALAHRDWGALYAMGVNPFLLWQFARSVSVPEEMAIDELLIEFRLAVEPHGYPEFFT